MSYQSQLDHLPMHAGLLEIEQALPVTLLARCVVVGPAATRIALTPMLPVEKAGRPRITLAVTHATWADTAVSIAECLRADRWLMDRSTLPTGNPACAMGQAWPVEFVAPSGWRAELVLAEGFSSADALGRRVAMRGADVLITSYPCGDISTFAPRPVPRLSVRVAAPGCQVLGDLLACDSPLARQHVKLRHARAAHGIACAALMSSRDLREATNDWPKLLRAAGYPLEQALQRACSSLADTTLEDIESLQRTAAHMLGESTPALDDLESTRAHLLRLLAG